ncbi:adenylyl cyclase-associated protein [Plakobranchus ocellatus]|uniref:Adenylyl cyclase-associated protein n=1 Tax=Plakobranchus ocellatus TaxID=259542 RepID=A0AAV4ADW4_9GAST|nr:adenylyl cyclase-associated protein [Plakobranchus ocellatus]
MLCCCAKNSATSYVIEDSAKPSQVPASEGAQLNSSAPTQHTTSGHADTKIITGKGALSTSSQNLSVVEANLDKSTVSATKREKSPITDQPVSSQAKEAVNSQTQPLPDNADPSEVIDKANLAQPKSVSVISVTKSQPPVSESIEKAIESSTSKALEASPNPIPAKLDSMNSAFDTVEKQLSEAESKQSAWEARSLVPGIATQVKVLTSQVLAQAASGMADQGLGTAVSRLEAVAARLEALAGSKSALSGGDSDALAPFVSAYDEILSGNLANFISLSNEIGGDVKNQAALVKEAFDAQRAFLVVASKSKQPSLETFQEVLKPTSAKLSAIQEYLQNNRRSEYFNHLSALTESIAALGWVTITPAPGPYVKEMADVGTFYTNRVLKDFKGKDEKHVEWTRAWIRTLSDLQAYIKEYHTTGVVWNAQVCVHECMTSIQPSQCLEVF